MTVASMIEQFVFGHDVRLHPITGMPIEQGHGALPDDEQAKLHCDAIEKSHGKEAADAMRQRLRHRVSPPLPAPELTESPLLEAPAPEHKRSVSVAEHKPTKPRMGKPHATVARHKHR